MFKYEVHNPRRTELFKYVTIAADQVHKGHSEGWLGTGDYKKIIEEHYCNGYEYIGWLPVTFGTRGTIKEIDMIFKAKEQLYIIEEKM